MLLKPNLQTQTRHMACYVCSGFFVVHNYTRAASSNRIVNLKIAFVNQTVQTIYLLLGSQYLNGRNVSCGWSKLIDTRNPQIISRFPVHRLLHRCHPKQTLFHRRGGLNLHLVKNSKHFALFKLKNCCFSVGSYILFTAEASSAQIYLHIIFQQLNLKK